MPKQIRRSRRERKVNQKYTHDGWDEKTLELLRESDQSDSVVLKEGEVNPPQASDDEFSDTVAQGVLDEEENSSEAGSNVSSQIITPTASDDDRSDTSLNESFSDQDNFRYGQRRPRAGSAQHSRGIPDFRRRLGKSLQWHESFGSELEDLQPLLEARSRWGTKGRDATVPSMTTLSQALLEDWNLDKTPKAVEDPTNIPSECIQSQKLREISTLETRKEYLPKELHHKAVLGSISNTAMYELPFLQSVNFGDAWKIEDEINAEPRSSDQILTSMVPEDSATAINTQSLLEYNAKVENAPRSYHEGWVLNTGGKIQCLAWAPQSDDYVQYLAVACRSGSEQRGSRSTTDPGSAPGFSPSTSYPAAIQIWSFATKTRTHDGPLTLDFEFNPFLCQVLACRFGGIREMNWMPTQLGQNHEDGLGLIAVISTDGKAHFVNVPQPDLSGLKSYHIEKPTISIKPPQGCIFTTCTFASPTDFIVGMSDGRISLYNLASASPDSALEPYATHQVHITYVLSVATAGCGVHSHFLASSSAASDLRLTDLRAFDQDSIHLPRARQPTKNLAYSSHTRSWISTSDSSGRTDAFKASGTRIFAHTLRFFPNTSHLGKFPQDAGSATAMATSQLHPYLLTGNSQGTVVCLNLTRKLLPAGSRNTGAWMQKLCQYDWIPQIDSTRQEARKANDHHQPTVSENENPSQDVEMHDEAADESDSDIDLFYGRDTRPGISRFREGFKPEKQDLTMGPGPNPNTKPKTKSRGKGKGKAKAKPKPKTKPKFIGRRTKKAAAAASTATVEDADIDGDDNNIEQLQVDGEEMELDDNPEAEAEADPNIGDYSTAEVIFEEEQAVTAIAWNVNPRCASWAAIGWGSGVLRVQDVVHFAP